MHITLKSVKLLKTFDNDFKIKMTTIKYINPISEILPDITTAVVQNTNTNKPTFGTHHAYFDERRNTTADASFLVDFNRTDPIRVRDLSIASTSLSSAFARYGSSSVLTFHERATRHRFVRNVFAILSLQFGLASGMCLTSEFM